MTGLDRQVNGQLNRWMDGLEKLKYVGRGSIQCFGDSPGKR